MVDLSMRKRLEVTYGEINSTKLRGQEFCYGGQVSVRMVIHDMEAED